MTSGDVVLILLIAGIGEIFAFFVFKFLIRLLNKEKNLKVDRAVIKGIIERLFLFLALVYGFPQALIAFGALKIGTRFVKEANKISNVLIAAGRSSAASITPVSRVTEVAKDDGQVVWELRMPREQGADYGVYRAERMYPPPLVRPIGE